MIVKRHYTLTPMIMAALAFPGAAIRTAAQNKVTARPTESKAPATRPVNTTITITPIDNASTAAASSSKAAAAADAPRYFYEFEQPDSSVYHIKIEHDATGRGQIQFERRTDAEPIVEPVQLSQTALGRINSLWKALNFLDSTVDYQSPKPITSIGTTRLRMTSGRRERTAAFNYSHDRDAFALANEYRRAADQAMFVFEIEVARENQPLDAPHLLSRLETMVARGGLSDPRQLIPLLRELNTDERLPLIARNQSARLLKKIEK